MFKKHVLPILGLVTLAIFGSWFVCAWSPPIDVQLYPRYHDGEMVYDTLPVPNFEDKKWWTDVRDSVEKWIGELKEKPKESYIQNLPAYYHIDPCPACTTQVFLYNPNCGCDQCKRLEEL